MLILDVVDQKLTLWMSMSLIYWLFIVIQQSLATLSSVSIGPQCESTTSRPDFSDEAGTIFYMSLVRYCMLQRDRWSTGYAVLFSIVDVHQDDCNAKSR